VTDDLNRAIVQTAADDARDTRAHRLLYVALALVVAGIAALGFLYVSQGQRIGRLVDAGNDSAKQSQALAAQVRALGATPVVQPAIPAPAGPTIIPAKDGTPGVGIADIQPGDCSVTIRLTDGRTRLVDKLCGPAGADAKPARGIASVAQDGCFVTVAYSDASSPTRLGSFCGPTGDTGNKGADGKTPPCMSTPTQCQGAKGDSIKGDPGRGVRKSEVVDCRWKVTYTDGVVEDAGNACTTSTAPATSKTSPPLIPTN
jgi:hypothetical protein